MSVAQVKEYASVGELVDEWLETKKPEQIKNVEYQAGSISFKSATPFVLSNLNY